MTDLSKKPHSFLRGMLATQLQAVLSGEEQEEQEEHLRHEESCRICQMRLTSIEAATKLMIKATETIKELSAKSNEDINEGRVMNLEEFADSLGLFKEESD